MSAQSGSESDASGTSIANIARSFYCHNCNIHIHIRDPDFEMICPICSSGFIEELPSIANPADASVSNMSLMGSPSGSGNTLNYRTVNRPGLRLGRHVSVAAAGNEVQAVDDNAPSTSQAHFTPHYNALDQFVIDFLQTITANDQPRGSQPQFFMVGNHADYVFGIDGMDNIITQLMNQTEHTGVPPMPKEMIEQIPKVKITTDEAESHLQCSICQDDFLVTETVCQLACTHKFHENCIVPWLEMHATCPICRKEFVEPGSSTSIVHVPDPPRPLGGMEWINYTGPVFRFDSSDSELD